MDRVGFQLTNTGEQHLQTNKLVTYLLLTILSLLHVILVLLWLTKCYDQLRVERIQMHKVEFIKYMMQCLKSEHNQPVFSKSRLVEILQYTILKASE